MSIFLKKKKYEWWNLVKKGIKMKNFKMENLFRGIDCRYWIYLNRELELKKK